MRKDPSSPPLLSISLLSSSVIAFELALMQLFSLTQWYHFAYMVLSVALLGFGAAGTFLSLFEARLRKRFDQVFPILAMSCAIAMTIVVPAANVKAVRFDSFLLFSEGRQVGRLVLTYLLFFTPFFLGALAIGLAFMRYIDRIGQLYAADLLGSGLGGLLALALMWTFLPWQLPAWIALLPLLAGMLTLRRHSGRTVIILLLTAIVGITWSLWRPQRLALSEFKSLTRTLLLPEARVEVEQNSPYGLLQVVSSPALRYAPGLSLAYTGNVPVYPVVFNNGNWIGSVVPTPPADSIYLMDYSTIALPWILQHPKVVLILDAGTGEVIAQALAHGSQRIDAVEANPVLLSLLRGPLAGANDSLLYAPEVAVHTEEARTFLETDTTRYDLIVLPILSAFGGAAGLDALQEQYTLTQEAFRAMWRRLHPEGMIAVTGWMDYPVRYPLKILATLVEVLKAEGIADPDKHLVAVRSWGMITFVLQRTPLRAGEAARIRAFCEQMSFDPVILPGLTPGERQQYNLWPDTLFFRHVDTLLGGERQAFYRTYPFNVRPATDNRPYFSQFIRWKSLPALADTFGNQAFPFLELGYLMVLLTFAQILLLAAVLIILPLFRLGFRGAGRGWTLVYFGSIGIGYMFVEIVLIQQFILFFGNPIYATAAVISGLLLTSGAGSYYSSRRYRPLPLWVAPTLVALVLFIYALGLAPLLRAAIGWPAAAKLVLLLALVTLPGFVMGIPFPSGLRSLSENEPDGRQVPWAWGVNGYFSVISTALATLIALEAGFWWVLVAAGLCYGLVAGISWRQKTDHLSAQEK